MIQSIYSEKIQNNGDAFTSDLNSIVMGDNDYFKFKHMLCRNICNPLEFNMVDPINWLIVESLKS